MSGQVNGDFEWVLLYLKESRGFDFTGYKRTSLARRVRRRMSQVGIDSYGEYTDHLQANSEEAYTLAMVFAEAIGPDRFRQRVKIYATDVDEDALAQRLATPRTRRTRSRTCRPRW